MRLNLIDIKMKRISIIIMTIVAAALITGCDRNLGPDNGSQVPEGEMAVRLSVSCPVITGTRASYVGGTENAISHISMICFDKDGKFILVKKDATLTSSTETTGTISGTVPGNTCRIHFVANFEGLDLSGFTMGSPERAVMQSTALSSGIDDEVRFWGYHREASESAMETWLTGGNTVQLLRDRAKVIVLLGDQTGNDDNTITSLQWTIGNGLKRGYIAPACVSGNDPYANTYVSATRLTEFSSSGRYGYGDMSSADIWTDPGTDTPQFLFENANSQNPVKVIIKATYSDATVKYHTVLLADNNVPFQVLRNQSFTITVKKLPKSLGSGDLEAALATTSYSNSPYAQVSREVNVINDDKYTLKVEDVEKMFNQDGTGVITFSYTAQGSGSISSLSASDFDVTWEAKSDDDSTDDVVAENSSHELTPPTVSFNSSTGEGTISFPLATLNDQLKHNTLQIVAKNSGLSRFVDVYSITQFSFSAQPALTAVSSTRTVGGKVRKVYELSFALPSDFPASQYPLKVSLFSSTLVPYSDASASAAFGSFAVVIGPTTDLGESTYQTDWNYKAKSWGYHYEYSIAGQPSGNTVKIYLYEVTGNLSRTLSNVGLYLQVDSFGSMFSLSQPNS